MQNVNPQQMVGNDYRQTSTYVFTIFHDNNILNIFLFLFQFIKYTNKKKSNSIFHTLQIHNVIRTENMIAQILIFFNYERFSGTLSAQKNTKRRTGVTNKKMGNLFIFTTKGMESQELLYLCSTKKKPLFYV